VRFDNLDNVFQKIIAKCDAGHYEWEYGHNTSSINYFCFNGWSGNIIRSEIWPSNNPQRLIGQWYHVVGVFTGTDRASDIQIYVNGQEVSVLKYQGSIGTLVPFPASVWSDQTSNATTEIGNIHWIYPAKNQYAVQLTDSVTLHNYYVYKTGPNLADAHPYTVLDGLKTVELYKWSKAGSPNGGAYALVQTLETNVPVDLLRCQDVVETFGPLTLTSGWYYIKVSFTINSLKYSDDGGLTNHTVSNSGNPFYGLTKVYQEYCIVTSRYDIGGAFWQPSNLQPCPDLKVNLQDTFSAALAFGSRPGLSNWNPAADVNGDQKVNLQDTFAISLAFGSVF
jgi:hypothetical protein